MSDSEPTSSGPRPGDAPGSLHVEPDAVAPTLRLMAYTRDDLIEEDGPRSLERALELRGQAPIVWLDVDGLGDADLISRIGERFGLHPLALEDVVGTHHRAKVDPYQDHTFLVLRVLTREEELESEQVSIFVGEGYVITFQENEGDCLAPVRRRIRAGRGLIRGHGPDYLAYAIVDVIVDRLFPLLDSYGETLDLLEERVMSSSDTQTVLDLQQVRRELSSARRMVWPVRDAVASLVRGESPELSEHTRTYLRDCQDHVVMVIDTLDSYKEQASGLVEVHLGVASQHMNEVMKVLTVFGTIFLPLSFIAGVYGMNFDTSSPYNMPELGWAWGYPAVMGMMAGIALGLLGFFYSKGWLGTPN